MPNFTLSQTGQNVQNDLNLIENGLASKYSALSTYNIGDIVIYNDKLYECNSQIFEPEIFNSSHWTEKTLAQIIQERVEKITTRYLHILRLSDSSTGAKVSLIIPFNTNNRFTYNDLVYYFTGAWMFLPNKLFYHCSGIDSNNLPIWKFGVNSNNQLCGYSNQEIVFDSSTTTIEDSRVDIVTSSYDA